METGIRTLTSIDLKDTTTSKMEDFGAEGRTDSGNTYRYVKAGGAVTAGNVVIAPSLVTNHQNCAVQAAAAAGATQLTLTLGATLATADQYAEGTLTIGNDGSGNPVTLKISGNSAAGSAGTITIMLDPTTPLPNALTTSNVASLAPNLHNGVTASSTAGLPVGVAVRDIASGSYGWVLTNGHIGVVNDAAGSLSALGKIKQSTNVAGAVLASSAATDIQIGYMIQAASASKAALAKIQIN